MSSSSAEKQAAGVPSAGETTLQKPRELAHSPGHPQELINYIKNAMAHYHAWRPVPNTRLATAELPNLARKRLHTY